MPALPPGDIDGFLAGATDDQQDIVCRLREIITQRAGGLAERVNAGRWLSGYLFFDGPDGQMVYAIGLTAGQSVTLHLMPFYGSPELQDRHGAALGPFQAGKSCLRFTDPGKLPADAIGAVVDATPRYLEIVASLKARPRKRPAR